MAKPMPPSTAVKNSEASTTMMKTITEVIQVSLRVVQVILRASARTSRKNCTGLVRFFGAGAAAPVAPAPAGAIAAAVLAARFFIADGLDPGFLAMLLRLTTF